MTTYNDQPSNYEVRKAFWLGAPIEFLQTIDDYEKQKPIAIDEARVKKFALAAGLSVEQVETILNHKITLDTGYYFDNVFSGLQMVIWFRLEMHGQAKKDYVERPRQGVFKARWGAPAYFDRHSHAAREVVKVASETYGQYVIRQMPVELAAKIIDRLHREIMLEWSKLD